MKPTMQVSAFVRAAAEDAYERLIFPSIEREVRSDLSDRAVCGRYPQFCPEPEAAADAAPCQGLRHHGS